MHLNTFVHYLMGSMLFRKARIALVLGIPTSKITALTATITKSCMSALINDIHVHKTQIQRQAPYFVFGWDQVTHSGTSSLFFFIFSFFFFSPPQIYMTLIIANTQSEEFPTGTH